MCNSMVFFKLCDTTATVTDATTTFTVIVLCSTRSATRHFHYSVSRIDGNTLPGSLKLRAVSGGEKLDTLLMR